MEKISVIVPVYNVEKYIEKCVDSIIRQSYPYLEIILVNDASTDISGKLCDDLAKKDERIKVFHNKKNSGVSSARNIGIQIATGDFIGFVDGDDIIERDMYEILISNFKRYNADIVACKERILLPNGVVYGDIQEDKVIVYQGEEIIANFLMNKEISISVQDKIFKHELLKNISFQTEMKYNEDKLFCYYALKKCNKYVQQNISKYNYVMRENSASHMAKFKEYLKIVDVNRFIENDVKTYGTDIQKIGAKLNLQLSILAACRRGAETKEIYSQRAEYIKLVKELRGEKVEYFLIDSKKRKMEFMILKRFPYIYSLLVRLYNWRKKIES